MKDLRAELKALGVENPVEIYHNLSYDELYKHETNPALTGYEKAYLTKSGALSVDTGIFKFHLSVKIQAPTPPLHSSRIVYLPFPGLMSVSCLQFSITISPSP